MITSVIRVFKGQHLHYTVIILFLTISSMVSFSLGLGEGLVDVSPEKNEDFGQLKEDSPTHETFLSRSLRETKQSNLELKASNQSIINPILPVSNISDTINQTYFLRDKGLTPGNSGLNFSLHSKSELRDIIVREEVPPELRLNITHLMEPRWQLSEDVSDGINSENFSLHVNNASSYDSKAITYTHSLSSASNANTSFFFALRSLYYDIGRHEANFSHVTEYPTVLDLNLTLREFSFTSSMPNSSISFDYFLRMGLKFTPNFTQSTSFSGGIFYIVFLWSDYFAPTSSPMLDAYNATLGNNEISRVFFFPKNLSIRNDPALSFNFNLTNLLWNLANFDASDDFNWSVVQRYFDSLTEIFFEWGVVASSVPANSTFRLQFSLNDIKVTSQIPRDAYSWSFILDNTTIHPLTSLIPSYYHYSSTEPVFLNASSIKINFVVQIVNESNYYYLYWNVDVQFIIFVKQISYWRVNFLAHSNVSMDNGYPDILFETNLTLGVLGGDVMIDQVMMDWIVPSPIEVENYTLYSDMIPNVSSISNQSMVNMGSSNINATHQLLSFNITVTDITTSLESFSTSVLYVQLKSSNRIQSTIMDSNVIIKGEDHVIEGLIADYQNVSITGKNRLNVTIYQNVTAATIGARSNFAVEITTTGYFLVYLSRNLTSTLVEGEGYVTLYWSVNWYQGFAIISTLILASSSTPTPAKIEELNGTSVYQFDPWIISGKLITPPVYVNSSAIVNLVLVENGDGDNALPDVAEVSSKSMLTSSHAKECDVPTITNGTRVIAPLSTPAMNARDSSNETHDGRSSLYSCMSSSKKTTSLDIHAIHLRSKGLVHSSVDPIMNMSLLVKNVSKWSLNLGFATYKAGNYTLITEWHLPSGAVFINSTFISILPSQILFEIKEFVQPSYTWISLELSFNYVTDDEIEKKMMAIEDLVVKMTLNGSNLIIIDGNSKSNGTITVFWSNLPDFWVSFQLHWFLVGTQGIIANDSIIILNQFENRSEGVSILGELELFTLEPNPILSNGVTNFIFELMIPNSSLVNITRTSPSYILINASFPFRVSSDSVTSVVVLVSDDSRNTIVEINIGLSYHLNDNFLLLNWSRAFFPIGISEFKVKISMSLPWASFKTTSHSSLSTLILTQVNVSQNQLPLAINLTIAVPIPENSSSDFFVEKYDILDDNQINKTSYWWNRLDQELKILYVGNFTLKPGESIDFTIYWYLKSNNSSSILSEIESSSNILSDIVLFISTISISVLLVYYKKKRRNSFDDLI